MPSQNILYKTIDPTARHIMRFLIAAGLVQSVAGSIPGAGPIFRVLKQLRNEGTSFSLQAAQDLCVVRMTT